MRFFLSFSLHGFLYILRLRSRKYTILIKAAAVQGLRIQFPLLKSTTKRDGKSDSRSLLHFPSSLSVDFNIGF